MCTNVGQERVESRVIIWIHYPELERSFTTVRTHPRWRVLTVPVNPGSDLQQHIPEEVYTRSDTHAHMDGGTGRCMPCRSFAKVLIQHDKTSVIYELIERNAFSSRSPSITSRLHTVKHITVRLGQNNVAPVSSEKHKKYISFAG